MMKKAGKYLLYGLSLLFFIYLLFDFYRRGVVTCETMKNAKENFTIKTPPTPSTPPPIIETLPEESTGSIMRRQSASMDEMAIIELKDVVIKSSFNSAYDGKQVSVDNIQKNLNDGFRLLDFEIYADKNKNPVIGYNPDKSSYLFNKKNVLLLKDVFSAITKYGFNAPSPNPFQPLFVNFRIYVTDTSEYVIYKKIASYIETFFTPYMLLDGNNVAIPITKTTTLGQLKQKLVVMIDTSILPAPYSKDEKLQSYEELLDKCGRDYAQATDCDSYYQIAPDYCQVNRWTNIQGGKEEMRIYTIQDLLRISIQPVLVNDDKSTNTVDLKFAYPNEIYNENENYLYGNILYELVRNHGVQFPLFSTYNNTRALKNMMDYFTDKQGGILTMEYVIKYYKADT